MLGRAPDITLLEGLIAAARGGDSASLVVSGEAGIGKTLLLDHAVRTAGDALVLTTTGSESESRLAFAGLSDLLAPLTPHIDGIPPPQAAALRGALALGPPVPGDRFTAYAAVLSLLAAAAADHPVVAVVDDAHWLDAESLEALLFTARRLEAEGVVLLLGARPGVNAVLGDGGLPTLTLTGLGPRDARRLLAEHAASTPDDGVAGLLVAGAAGNPLALIELAQTLTPGQLTGGEPLPEPLPVGPHLATGLLRPLASLPAATRRALLVVSADDGTIEPLAGALIAAGLVPDDLTPAVEAGVLHTDMTRLRFSHPLLRSAVYRGADAPDRRAAHRAHAAAAGDDPASLDRRAWHLALAATGPDEAVAADLEAAAGRAAARTANAAAADALETAARLSVDAPERAARLLAAGQSALLAGRFARASALLDEVAALDADPGRGVEAMVARVFAEGFGGSARAAIDMLVGVADRMAPVAPQEAALLLAQGTFFCQMRADVPTARLITSRATELAEGAPAPVAALVAIADVSARTFEGLAAELPDWAEPALAERAAAGDHTVLFWAVLVSHIRMLEERYDVALASLAGYVDHARANSLPSALPLALGLSAEVLSRIGRLDEARAAALESAQIAEDTGQKGARGYSLGVAAQVEAVLGLGDDCRRHAEALVEDLAHSDALSLTIFRAAALGHLALVEGRLDEARAHFEAAHGTSHRGGTTHPLLVPHLEELVEVLLRLGRESEARRFLDGLEEEAVRCGASWPAASAARCRALLAPDDGFEAEFARALEMHDRTPTPFPRARTLLALGERRRRARRAADARAPLREALEVFDAIGAAPWAGRARDELRAAGGEVPEPRSALGTLLTPRELQIALVVAGGATSREAADALLTSPKTVDHHLGRVYAKLGVRTRAELARRMSS